MDSSVAVPEVKGVPSGLVGEPISSSSEKVRGVPEGLSAEPIGQSNKAAASAKPTTAEPVAGVPANVTPHALSPQQSQIEALTKKAKEHPYSLSVDEHREYDRLKMTKPDVAERDMTDAYAYAQAQGWTPEEAQQYANEDSQQRMFTRAGKAIGNKFQTVTQSIGNAIGAPHLPERLRNPFFETDEGRRASEARIQNEKGALDTYAPTVLGAALAPYGMGDVGKAIGSIAGTLDEHLAHTIDGLASPMNIALLAASHGLEGTAAGAPVAVQKVARTTQQLANAGFTAQMAEGSGQSFGSAWNSFVPDKSKGEKQNVPEAIGYMLDGLVNGAMAAGGVHEAIAHETIKNGLDATTETVRPGKKFGDLTDPEQAIVINKYIEDSPEARQAADISEEQMLRNAKKLNYKHNRALAESWNPNAAARAIRDIHERREQGQKEALQSIREGYERQRKESLEEYFGEKREKRIPRAQEAAEQRAEVGRVVSGIADKREEVWNRRNESQSEQTANDVPKREVEAVISDNGQLTYPAFYWGEENSFGVAADQSGHAVYRQTPRGVEWLDSSGNFTEQPSDLYSSPDPETADTVARLTALGAHTSTLADEAGATPEQVREADEIAGIRRDLVSGEISNEEAQRRAGLADKAKLPDEFTAARDGRLNGPFHESNADAYYRGLEVEAQAAGMSEEETNRILDESGLIARQQTENNLNHVYRPGDYITSKKGVKWTLDSKGMLHPNDGGQPVPLMKRGLYSNDAVQLAQSGQIGYGTKTREERRADASRARQALVDIRNNQEAVDREMRLAAQREGLQGAAEAEPRGDIEEKRARQERIMSRPPRPAESQIGQIVRMIFKAPTDANSVIHAIAQRSGVSDEEVMRLQLANDPNRAPDTESKVARLEVGDKVSDAFRKDRPWTVEQGKDGNLYLRSGNASPLLLDRLNPSERIKQLVERGTITTDRDEFTPDDVARAAFDTPHYVRYQESLAEEVKDRDEGRVKDPEPRNIVQAKTQAEAAERRSNASESVATRAVIDALEPTTDSIEQAERQAENANEEVKTAEKAYSQTVEAVSKTDAKDAFPPRAPATIGLRGSQGVITQNSREVPFHYELLPIEGLVTSHIWQGGQLVVNEDFPAELQPRTISENESRQNDLRGARRAVDESGRTIGYDFRQYADKTINGSMGPAIVDDGGRVVGGNTRLAIMRRHLENLAGIADPEEREAYQYGFKSAMRKLAEENGIPNYPDDGKDYVVVRMMDKPIEDTREAAELGRLFNKSVSVQIAKSARGISYSKSLDEPVLSDIGRRVESYDGIAAAIQADPEFFRDIVTERFGVDPAEYVDWFADVPGKGLVLNEQGREQFTKALLGTVVKDPSVLNRIEGKTPYRAMERALAYVVQMRAVPGRDISGKIVEALQAASETMTTDPSLSASNDKWLATYHPDQTQFAGMETDIPPEPDRIVEALWRALHASDAAVPRVFNDRLKAFIGEESSRGGNLFGAAVDGPAEAFNRAFSRELTEVKHSRRDRTEGITQDEFDHALKNREMSEVERSESEAKADGKESREKSPEQADGGVTAPPPAVEAKMGMERPPKPPTKQSVAVRDMAITKTEQGYVTPDKLKEFLDSHPATKGSSNELMRTARMMSEYVYDIDPPVGIDRKDALDWVLKERLAGIEGGKLKTKRGQYSDPNVEKNWGDRIMKLHKAADASTFIHEFAHVVFPLLSDEDLKAIDTIRGTAGRGEAGQVWDGDRRNLTPETYKTLSEKMAHGLEQFLRDENPTGFTSEVKAVLAKVKEIMRKVYLKFAGDPLSEFANTEESREVFSKMFGITSFDVQDNWRNEVKKARAEEKRLKRPDEEPHPLQRQASEAGATGIRNTFAGKVEDSVGGRVDPRQPVAVFVFPDANRAATYWSTIASAGSKIDTAELIQADDGTYGVRFNTRTKVPSEVLYQDVPRKHPGIELEETKKRLADTPESAPMIRKLLQLKVQNLENEIRSKYGAETEASSEPVDAKQAVQEVKSANADRIRKDANGLPGVQETGRPTGIPKPPDIRRAGNGTAGERGVTSGRPVARVPTSLADVKAVNLEPLRSERGQPVGTVAGEAFDGKAWVAGLKVAGLPENLPPPTWALDRKTADKLIFPGQKQIVQTVLSAFEQGDGIVVATTAGTGKTFTGMGTIKEWITKHPDAKVLYITKNASLLKDAQGVSSNTFGFDLEREIPDANAPTGVYGASYQGIVRSDATQKTNWDLVVADESGEARNWFKEDNKQGKALKAIIANSGKAAYFSATPFHSPMEYGYLDKLNLWPKNGFDKWIENNFAHEKIDDKVVAKLDPAKQAKLRQQLIERGQLVSQAISYDGFTAHFGVVPVTDAMKRGLDRIHEGFARAKKQLIDTKKKGLAEKVAAFEATYTKAFLERERLPQAIEIAVKARQNGWQVMIFSETSSEDLFRREVGPGMEPSTYQQLDEAMGGQLSKIIPPFGNVYDRLSEEFGGQIGDYSGRGNSMAERDEAKADFLSGKRPMIYTTYAAGGTGVSLHDADYPDRGIKGGDKPRVAIYLGPPYSGVLLEQSMGRPWRFGVKSDVHAVFLATDSEPDVRLMQQKVGPRMRALRASVLGERDSLASVMGSYTTDEKVRARQEALAYQEGNEVEVNAASYQVRNKSRNVGINDWSQINFPPASTAMNKGMKYGEDVVGGDWSSLYQSKFGLQPPESPEQVAGKNTVDAIGNGLASGTGLPPGVSVQNLDPADRDVVVGASSAVATDAVDQPVERDRAASARQSMKAQLNLPGEKDKWVLTFPKGKAGVWRYTGDPEDLVGGPERESGGPKDVRTWYLANMFSQEVGIKSIARQAGAEEAGENIVRMNRSYQADADTHFASFAMEAQDIMRDNKLDVEDPRVMSELWDAVEGKRVTDNPAIEKAAGQIATLHERVHGAEADADVKLRTPAGDTISWKEITKDRSYMPHRIDWDAQLEDPATGETHTLREVMKETFAEASRRRIIDAIARERNYTYDQVVDYLKAYAPNTPVLGHINRARTLDFPFVKKDWKTLMGYYRQASDAIAVERNFGSERGKLEKEISRIPSENGRKTIHSMFDGLLQPGEWEDWTARVYNGAIAFEAATKMTISVTKVPFHLVHIPVGLRGRVKPMVRAMLRTALHPTEVMENASYVGTIARQLNAADVISGQDSQGITHQIFGKTGFNAAYKIVRGISGESARIWMEQYAMRELKKGNASEARRLLRDVMLIGDGAIDQAIANGRFTPEDLAKAQTGFANLTTWSNNPLQMPGWARLHIAKNESTMTVGLKRAVRLTYALQSFSLKSTSLLREQLWDEVSKHKNYKPLAYAVVAYPIIGQLLAGTSAGTKHFIHKGMEGLQGKKHQADSWDKFIAGLEDAAEHPTAVKFLKFWVDGMTLGVGWDRTRRVLDPLLNMASGKNKEARGEFRYMWEDELNEEIGPAFNEIVNLIKLGANIGEIESAEKHGELKPGKVKKAVEKYATDEVPILKQVPFFNPPPKKRQ